MSPSQLQPYRAVVLNVIGAERRLLGLERPAWATRKPVDVVPSQFVEESTRVLREAQQRNCEAAQG